MRSVLRAQVLRAQEYTHPRLSWDADLPFEQIHGAVRSFSWLCVETLVNRTLRR